MAPNSESERMRLMSPVTLLAYVDPLEEGDARDLGIALLVRYDAEERLDIDLAMNDLLANEIIDTTAALEYMKCFEEDDTDIQSAEQFLESLHCLEYLREVIDLAHARNLALKAVIKLRNDQGSELDRIALDRWLKVTNLDTSDIGEDPAAYRELLLRWVHDKYLPSAVSALRVVINNANMVASIGSKNSRSLRDLAYLLETELLIPRAIS